MKKIICALFVFALSNCLAISAEPINQTCMSSIGQPQTKMQEMPDGTLVQQVMCCCQNATGNQCCNFQSACLGLVKGCICMMNSLDSEPDNSSATSVKS